MTSYPYMVSVDEKTHLFLQNLREKMGFKSNSQLMKFIIECFIKGYNNYEKSGGKI